MEQAGAALAKAFVLQLAAPAMRPANWQAIAAGLSDLCSQSLELPVQPVTCSVLTLYTQDRI